MTHDLHHEWRQGDVGVALDGPGDRTFVPGSVVKLREIAPRGAEEVPGDPCGVFIVLLGGPTNEGTYLWWDDPGPPAYIEELRCIRRIDNPRLASYLTLVIHTKEPTND